VKKPLFAMLLGGVLGVFDGLTALVSAPEIRSQIVSIVIGSTFKGLIVGVLIGFFAKKVKSLAAVIIFGVVVSTFFAYLVAAMQGKYYVEIMAPGAIVGLIVGYAAQKHLPNGEPRTQNVERRT
jgi:hypothetical protein